MQTLIQHIKRSTGQTPEVTPSLFAGHRAQIRLHGQTIIGQERETEQQALIALCEVLDTRAKHAGHRDTPLFENGQMQLTGQCNRGKI